ncbi:hypothetical protein Tco_1262261 [Tanacetum coccineum]
MAGVDVDTLTMEQYLAFLRENQAPGVVKPKIRGNVNFEINSQFMRELREDTFSGNKNEDPHDHIDRVLSIVGLFNIPGVSKDAVMHRVFPFTPYRSRKKMGGQTRPKNYQYLGSPQKVLYPKTMADHSQKWHDRTTSRNIGSSSSNDGLAALVNKLDNLGRDMKKLKESVHAIQVGCQICEGPHLDKDCPSTRKLNKLKRSDMENLDEQRLLTGTMEESFM